MIAHLVNRRFSWVKYLLPTFVCLMLVLLNTAVYSSAVFINAPVLFVWSVIFYFAVYHPLVLNVICVFFIGVFADLITAGPFGIHAFSFVLMFFVANLNRRFLLTLKFSDVWAVFGLILFAVQIIEYILSAALMMMWPPLLPMVFQYVVLMLTYPLISWGCGWLNLKIGGAS